jgi:hypothetical protein
MGVACKCCVLSSKEKPHIDLLFGQKKMFLLCVNRLIVTLFSTLMTPHYIEFSIIMEVTCGLLQSSLYDFGLKHITCVSRLHTRRQLQQLHFTTSI